MSRTNPCTLVFLVKDNSVLLARKRGGEAVDGTLLGPGGKIEVGETARECAIRETVEELGITPLNLVHAGYVEFDNSQNDYGTITTGEVYLCTKWRGNPRSSRELDNPTWYPINNLPLEEMSYEKRFWIPQLLAGQKLRAFFCYDEHKQLVERRVDLVDTART